jgi:hypothetical protein
MSNSKNAKAFLSVVLAVLMAAVFMPSLTYSSFAATAKKASKITKTNHAGKSVKAKAGKSYTLKYKLSPSKLTSSAKKVVWKSSNSKIVKVTSVKSGYAKVKALKAGSAKVTVTSKSNKKAAATWNFKVSKASTIKKTALTSVSIKMMNAGSQDISKTVKVGNELSAVVAPAGSSVTYQWYADGQEISGANDASFKVTTAEIGKAITVKATGTGNYTGTVESSATAKVADEAVESVSIVKKNTGSDAAAKPTVAVGTPQVDDELTASVTGTDASNMTYQWYRVGHAATGSGKAETAISGATSSTYTITKADIGYQIRLKATPKTGVSVKAGTTKVTAGTAGYDGTLFQTADTSAVSSAVTVKIQANGKDITGGVTAGTTLTAAVTPASAASDLTYQWTKDGKAISGATSATYTATESGTYNVLVSKASGSSWGTVTPASAVKVGKSTFSTVTVENTTIKQIARTTNLPGDVLSAYVPKIAASNYTITWYVKATSANGLKQDAPLTLGTGNKIPATYSNGSKTVSLIGESIYAAATGNGDYAGSTATSDLIKVTGDISTGKVTVAPTTGIAVGTTLTASSDAVKALSTSDYTVQWYSVDTKNTASTSDDVLTPISGATSLSYTVDKAYAGGTLAVKITGTGNYAGTITSSNITVANAK